MSGKFTTLFLLLLAVVYAVLFYHAEMGVNLLIFDALLLGTALRCRPELAKYRAFIWSAGGLLFAAGCVVIVHGEGALWAHHLTYLLVLGFAQARELRFFWYGFLLGGITLFRGPLQWFRRQAVYLREVSAHRTSRPAWRYVKQVVPALVILVPFLIFYLGANRELARGVAGFFGWVGNFSVDFALLWSVALFGFATVLFSGLLFPRLTESRLVNQQVIFRDELVRTRPERSVVPPRAAYRNYRPKPNKMTALRDEYRQGLLTFGLLNAVLAVVNLTDLTYVWLPSGDLSAATLSEYVHVGTWNLCISIGLAMLVVLYYFRGNLNFLRDSRLLRQLARIWLAQNALLAMSVAVRNYHYIDAYGLALGRVYVGFVLLLILFGLFTLLRKVDRRLTLSYLLHSNGLTVWLLLLAFGAINWPGVITRFNLATQTAEEVDWRYLQFDLDRRNSFILRSHCESADSKCFQQIDKYRHQPTDWRSWNYADWRNERATR